MTVRRRLGTLLAFLVAGGCLFARLGTLPLIQPDEGRNAEVAREMKDAGAWLVPTYDGLPYLDKPALYFRMVALSMSALGETETAARLPGALAALALLGLVWAFCRHAWGGRAAALAVLVVGTTPLIVAFARIVILDMPLALFVTGAILAGFRAEERDGAARAAWYLAAAACAGVGTLLKGPVGFLLPVLVLVAFNLVDGNARALGRVFAARNVLLFLAIVLPWFLGLAWVRRDFAYYGLVEESLHRFTTSSFHRTAPWWYYAPVTFAVLFPWSLLLPESVAGALRARARWTRADRLLMTWAVVVVLFFSVSQSKLPGYVLTGVVALGMLIARVLDLAFEAEDGYARALLWRATAALAVIGLGTAALLAAGLGHPGGFPALLGLEGGEASLLGPAAAPLLWSVGALALVAIAALSSRALVMACATFALLPLLLLTVAFGGVEAYAEADSGRTLAAGMPALPPGTELACLECLPNGLPFYLKQRVTLITRDGSETTSNYVTFVLRRAPQWPAGVVRRSDVDRWLAGRGPATYLLAGERQRAALDSIAWRAFAKVEPVAPGWWGAFLGAPSPSDTATSPAPSAELPDSTSRPATHPAAPTPSRDR
ncbi:MAG TPA: glycosyltransferase family 39 protein [Gemmatimonadales bacterium]|nr:glycosyltransferase family 39 protein [Gemmatimonadales bacterium]